MKSRKLFVNHVRQPFVIGFEPCNEVDLALMVFIVEQIKVVSGVIACIYDAGFYVYSESFYVKQYPFQR